jgi:hypothetical protein
VLEPNSLFELANRFKILFAAMRLSAAQTLLTNVESWGRLRIHRRAVVKTGAPHLSLSSGAKKLHRTGN